MGHLYCSQQAILGLSIASKRLWLQVPVADASHLSTRLERSRQILIISFLEFFVFVNGGDGDDGSHKCARSHDK